MTETFFVYCFLNSGFRKEKDKFLLEINVIDEVINSFKTLRTEHPLDNIYSNTEGLLIIKRLNQDDVSSCSSIFSLIDSSIPRLKFMTIEQQLENYSNMSCPGAVEMTYFIGEERRNEALLYYELH